MRWPPFHVLQHQLRGFPVALDGLFNQGRDDLFGEMAVVIKNALFQAYAQRPAQLRNRRPSAWVTALALLPGLAFWPIFLSPFHVLALVSSSAGLNASVMQMNFFRLTYAEVCETR